MKTLRCNLRQVRLVILVCQLGLILRTEAQIPRSCTGHKTYRPPAYRDITAICGTEYIDLSIFLCPLYYARYDESLIVLNKQFNKPECFGTPDWTSDPPVLRFRFLLMGSSISFCNNNMKIIDKVGSGVFADFSSIQFVNISGTVTSVNPFAGMITYRPRILYKFSCLYPTQYLLNNTEVGVAGQSLAIKDNNGTFISTLSMVLYKDEQYNEILIIPKTGLKPKTRIHVAVKATNLTNRFNVLLNRCYTTTTPHPMFNTYYDLFVGCPRDPRTKLALNGESQVALFSFEAFRFVEHKNKTISTFYLHCVTRLCEVSSCSRLKPDCGSSLRLSKREAQYLSDSTTITSPPILVATLSAGVTDRLSTTDIPSYNQTEKEYKYNTDPPSLSYFDGGSSSSQSCYSIFLMAVTVCNVIYTMCFSV